MKKNKEDEENILQRAWRKEPEFCKLGIVWCIPVMFVTTLWILL